MSEKPPFYMPQNYKDRKHFVKLRAGCCYITEDGMIAKFLETGVNPAKDGQSCVGYFLGNGHEEQWLPDGGIYEDFASVEDLIREVTDEEVEEYIDNRFKAQKYYWTNNENRIVKILETGIAHWMDGKCSIVNLGYWLDTGEADLWNDSGSILYLINGTDPDDATLCSEATPEEVISFNSGKKQRKD